MTQAPDETLEGLIASFNSFEVERGLFQLRDPQGFPWWDLVRYRVRFALFVKSPLSASAVARPPAKLVRAASFARQTGRLLRDIARLRSAKARRARSMIVSTRALGYLDMAAAREAAHGIIFVSKSGEANAPHAAIAAQSLQFFTRMAKRAQRVPAGFLEEARRVAGEICARFETKADILGLILAKYLEELAARRAWSFVLGQAGALERLIFVNDDTVKSLIFLARARGMDTEEVQHAYMGRAHVGFSYPALDSALPTLPHRLIVTRDSGDINYPVEQAVVRLPERPRASVPRDIDVLIGSSPAARQQTVDTIAALLRQGLRLAVKLHPAETKKTSEVYARFSQDGVAFHDGTEDFCALASRARLFIPVNATSTTAFEAAEMGARVILVDFDSSKKTLISNGVAAARAGSPSALPQLVSALLGRSDIDGRK